MEFGNGPYRAGAAKQGIVASSDLAADPAGAGYRLAIDDDGQIGVVAGAACAERDHAELFRPAGSDGEGPALPDVGSPPRDVERILTTR